MKPLNYLFIFFSILLFISCDTEFNEPKAIDLDTKSQALIKADNAFGLDLFQRMNADETKNFTISPLSFSLALAMTYNGTKTTTQTAMEEAMHLRGLTPHKINQSYRYLMDALLEADNKVTLTTVQSIWYRNDMEVFEPFKQVNKTYYDAEVNPLDFTSSTALETINNWIANQTQDKIIDMIKEIEPTHVMFLINAIYFNGIWKTKFEKENTKNQNFIEEDGTTIQVMTMEKTDKVNYQSNELFTSVELPYGHGNFNMEIFLPNDAKTCNDLVAEMTPENWETWMNDYEAKDSLLIRLPKFKTEFNTKLNDYLANMGMDEAFHPGADFSGITNTDIWIDYVQHNTYIDVNEEGTEAAAATVVALEWRSVSPSFIVNKPFVYAITEKGTGAILFLGKIMEPKYN